MMLLFKNKKNILIVFTLGFFVSALFFGISAFSVNAQSQGENCGEYSHGNFPQGSLPGYGAPYDTIRENHADHLSINCFSLQESSVVDTPWSFYVGTGDERTIIWKTGYISRLSNDFKEYLQDLKRETNYNGSADRYRDCYTTFNGGFERETCFDGNKFDWESFNFSTQGLSNSSSNWLNSQTYKNVDKAEPTSYYDNFLPTYFIAYLCTYVDGGWKCGCQDGQTCTNSGKWQIQKVFRE